MSAEARYFAEAARQALSDRLAARKAAAPATPVKSRLYTSPTAPVKLTASDWIAAFPFVFARHASEFWYAVPSLSVMAGRWCSWGYHGPAPNG